MNQKPNKQVIVQIFVILIFLTGNSFNIYGKQQSSIPHLQKQATATQLIVSGKPFLIRGGELGNSSSSSLEYMNPAWQKLAKMNLNTVLMPVYWELIELEEGKFDFSLVDDLIREARKNNLKLVPLWFASWKNSMSCYAPAWVKTNQQRFPRAADKAGNGMEIMSPFSDENMNADANAFKPGLGDQMAAMSGGQIAGYVFFDFIVGILLVWTYAAIRPRFGPGA
ncbi:MAG: hypothetical protein ABJA66_10910, partial [Actinomycetota bacterium]